jgi:hypothetical protein
MFVPTPHAAFEQSSSYLSNCCLTGGLSLAPHLIKETVRDLQEHCPSVKVFSTLSPIPNFVKWLSKVLYAPSLYSRTRLGFSLTGTLMGAPC